MTLKTSLSVSFFSLLAVTAIGQEVQDKENQIQINPQTYQKMGGQLKEPEFNTKAEKDAYSQKQKSANKPVREHSAFPADPTFPKYINTGNKSLDDSNYMTAKDEWITKNQAKYDQMGTPEEAPLSKAERLKLNEQLKN
jgi:hypothetical protein